MKKTKQKKTECHPQHNEDVSVDSLLIFLFSIDDLRLYLEISTDKIKCLCFNLNKTNDFHINTTNF